MDSVSYVLWMQSSHICRTSSPFQNATCCRILEVLPSDVSENTWKTTWHCNLIRPNPATGTPLVGNHNLSSIGDAKWKTDGFDPEILHHLLPVGRVCSKTFSILRLMENSYEVTLHSDGSLI